MEWVLKIWFSGTRLEGKWNKAFFCFLPNICHPWQKSGKKWRLAFNPFLQGTSGTRNTGFGNPANIFFYKCNLRLQQLTRCEGIFFLHIFGQKVKNYLFSSLIFGRGNLSFGLFFISKTSGKRCKSNFRITNL